MGKVIISIFLVFLALYVIPFVVYGSLSPIWGLKTPEGASPSVFLLSVLISKIGTAIAFVLIYYFARNSMHNHIIVYSFLWLVMFVFGEIGQVIGLQYSWKEATAGVISELIYVPISALIVYSFL